MPTTPEFPEGSGPAKQTVQLLKSFAGRISRPARAAQSRRAALSLRRQHHRGARLRRMPSRMRVPADHGAGRQLWHRRDGRSEETRRSGFKGRWDGRDASVIALGEERLAAPFSRIGKRRPGSASTGRFSRRNLKPERQTACGGGRNGGRYSLARNPVNEGFCA